MGLTWVSEVRTESCSQRSGVVLSLPGKGGRGPGRARGDEAPHRLSLGKVLSSDPVRLLSQMEFCRTFPAT